MTRKAGSRRRSYFDDNSGHRTEFGPQFYFYWTNLAEMRHYRYFRVDLTKDCELALAPGELFESGVHRIVLEGDKLTLDQPRAELGLGPAGEAGG